MKIPINNSKTAWEIKKFSKKNSAITDQTVKSRNV